MSKTLMFLLSLIIIFVQVEIVDAQQLPPDSLIQNLINQTNLDTLVHFVNVLSGEDSVTINDSTYLLLSRNAVHAHNDLAADYIFQTLSRFGLPTSNQNYSATGRNVFATQTGTHFPDQEFIICAHYDDMPVQPPAPGADDNASGVAAVLEVARILSQIQTKFTVIYALWDEEEIGWVGSGYYATQAYQAGDSILGVVNLDMLGWDSNNDGLIDIHTDTIAQSIPLANLIDSLEASYNIGLNPVIYNPGTENSDHKSFWDQGYSAVIFSEAYWGGDFNPFLHTSSDTIVNFNLNYFHKLSRLAVATMAYLSLHDSLTNTVEEGEGIILAGFELGQNYPNPFNPTTTIEFSIPKAEFVTLKIYNILGEEVTTLVSERLTAGQYKYQWDASGLPSGVYFYKLEAVHPSTSSPKESGQAGQGFVQTKKMLLIR
jgi:hypothetical protein